jgi:hypothetical protein
LSSLTLALVAHVVLADAALAADVYRWRDAGGGLHFSNRPEIAPPGSEVSELPVLGTSTRRRRAVRVRGLPMPVSTRRADADAVVDECAASGSPRVAHAMVRAVSPHLRGSDRDNFTLLVDGEPVLYGRDTVLQQINGVDLGARSAVLSMAAVAYPEGASPCDGRPAFERYPVSTGRRGGRRSLCDDFRRAFAEVGVAANRDHGVARSFREIAIAYAVVAANDATIRSAGSDEPMVLRSGPPWPTRLVVDRRPSGSLRVRGGTLPPGHSLVERPMETTLPPWLVDGHAAQTAALADDTEAFVSELTIALEEIDAAAQAAGCW